MEEPFRLFVEECDALQVMPVERRRPFVDIEPSTGPPDLRRQLGVRVFHHLYAVCLSRRVRVQTICSHVPDHVKYNARPHRL